MNPRAADRSRGTIGRAEARDNRTRRSGSVGRPPTRREWRWLFLLRSIQGDRSALMCQPGHRALHRIQLFAKHFDLAPLFGDLELLGTGLAVQVVYELVQGLNRHERDAVGVDRADALRSLPESERRVKVLR